MTIPLPPALPPHFNIGGYKITALVESGPDYHLYQALSPEGHAVLIREFCPGGLVTRDLASGELAVFPENESQFAQAREAFETQYAANAESKLRGFGTVLFLYPLSPPRKKTAATATAETRSRRHHPRNAAAADKALRRVPGHHGHCDRDARPLRISGLPDTQG